MQKGAIAGGWGKGGLEGISGKKISGGGFESWNIK